MWWYEMLTLGIRSASNPAMPERTGERGEVLLTKRFAMPGEAAPRPLVEACPRRSPLLSLDPAELQLNPGD